MVWERTDAGQRVRKLYDAPYYFYAKNEQGNHRTITGVAVEKIICHGSNDFDQTVADYQLRRIPIFESDISPLERVMMDVYSARPAPKLVIGLLDIEVDYNPDIGFAGPQNPYAPINAVTIAVDGVFATIAVPPQGWDWSITLPKDLENVILVKTERELLELMLDLIFPCDVLSGWNSEFYDLPYTARRVELVLGKQALDRLSLEGGPSPRWSEKARFKHSKEKDPIIDLETRVHLDYLLLFAKFDLTKRQSYSLDNVAFEELGENKIHYEGSLAALYKRDFLTFIRYNIHDVTLLVRLDAKFKYIELANQMVHMASINFDGVFGSVQLIDTAIMNYAHNNLNLVVTDRNVRPPAAPVEGAIVVTPNTGFYKWIGACDINSLYPSTIRSLNLSLERLVGQLIKPSEENEWEPVPLTKAQRSVMVAKKYQVDAECFRSGPIIKGVWTYYLPDGQIDHVNVRYGEDTGAENPPDDAVYDVNEFSWRVFSEVASNPNSQLKEFLLDVKFDSEREIISLPANVLVEYVLDNKLAVSAFGTILDQSEQGLVPMVLTSWFKGRKEMQAKKKQFSKEASEILKQGIKLTAEEVKALTL